MVHDRRIDGQTTVFGNAGSLYMNAMTWWDHDTQSIWSQPVGRAIEGAQTGLELFLLPSELTTWSNWLNKHPDTLLMSTDLNRLGSWPQGLDPDFVIGLVLGNDARAYYYKDVAAQGVLNDQLGETPVLLWAEGDGTAAYSRLFEDGLLTFRLENRKVRDEETNSTWDPMRGLAIEGPLRGKALRQLPTLSSFDWAWNDFYPDSGFYQP